MKLQQKTIEKLRELINEETEYRSGQNLVKFFNQLGFKESYGQGFPSRWVYTEEHLKSINGTKTMEECIKELFAPVNYIGRFDELDKFIYDLNQYLSFDGYKVARVGKNIQITTSTEDITPPAAQQADAEDEFLRKEFKEVSLSALKLDGTITGILEQRLKEIQKCLNSKASLACIFLCGSTLEGILLGVATNNPKKFNQAKSSPKKAGKVLPFHQWTLSNFIDVAREAGLINEDVKKFSHVLRDFRNYIHPYAQASQGFNPDEHTAKLCWQVLKVAIFQIVKNQ